MEYFSVRYDGFNIHLQDIDSVIEIKKKIQQKVINMKMDLEENETELKKLKQFLRLNCKHNWVSDHVDLMKGYRESVPIKYCEICELNFN